MRVAAQGRLVDMHGSADTPTYWKVPFEWGRSQVLLDEDEPDGVSWLHAEGDERLLGVVAGVLAASPDASDVAAVAAAGALNAARRLLEAPPTWGFSHEVGWWTLLTFRGEAAAFVLPVTYDNCARDGLDEATIFHMGVLPDHRGRRLGRALLRQATRTLLAHGIWRIYCDTAANNAPMIHLFESEGWHRLSPHERPV
jgi:ribosomal protein S18 acetylase RimI-like enzyme